ncbi:LysR family transcriptional regulator ArgP [Novosphingobium umbonatum]|uniref:LysR family transcriptional regulator ArgP n=1 Tax=Novosphingobium umbonatum TaxID=1908524 RepID=A0A437N7E8_9SPHN|nr:LysR family transcriptional regulator ArgP [Novosphingobium umbonatum]RVU05817.1 LysR family transcriptional regulator ArgP [Novosphingobium umbonatum]
MLDYAALSVVAAVLREGTFERAAAVLHISPSAVSQRVRALEERLGAILVLRSQPCQPTPLGQRLCAHFDAVRLLEADLAPDLGALAADRLQPVTVKIAVNSDSLASWLAPALAQFAQETGLLVELIMDDEAHTAQRLRHGEVAAAITSDNVPVQGCRSIRLGVLPYRACASPAFMARYFPSGVTADGLIDAPYMRFDRRDGLQALWAMEHLGAPLGHLVHWIPSTRAFLDLALRGMAWGMQPEHLVRSHLAAGSLVELRPDSALGVTLYWTVARLHADALKVLTRAVRRAAGLVLQP